MIFGSETLLSWSQSWWCCFCSHVLDVSFTSHPTVVDGALLPPSYAVTLSHTIATERLTSTAKSALNIMIGRHRADIGYVPVPRASSDLSRMNAGIKTTPHKTATGNTAILRGRYRAYSGKEDWLMISLTARVYSYGFPQLNVHLRLFIDPYSADALCPLHRDTALRITIISCQR